MISYKEWKQLNESIIGMSNIGLVQPQNLGILSNSPTVQPQEVVVDADSNEDDEIIAEVKKKIAKLKKKMDGDGEVVPPAAKKDADPDADAEAAADSEGGDKEEKSKIKPEKEPTGDEEDGDHDEPDGDEVKDKDNHDEEPDGEVVDKSVDKKPVDGVGKATEMMMKKKMKKDGKKKMTKEETDWWASVNGQLKNPERSWDGFSKK